MNNLAKGYIDIVLVILIWSGFILVSRLGGKSELLAYDVVALRFGVAALLLLPVWVWRNKVNLLEPKIIALALSGGIGYATLAYLGFKNAPAAHGGILLPGMLPFEVALFSWLLLQEYPSKRRMTGLATIALGVVCLAAESMDSATSSWKGDLAFIGGGTIWALYSVLVRKWKISVWDATIGSALVSALIYIPIYVFFLPKQMDMASWQTIGIQAFYQGFMAVIVAMILYMRAVVVLGPSKVGLYMALVPVISGLAAVPILHESLTIYVMLGLAFTSAGAWLGNRG